MSANSNQVTALYEPLALDLICPIVRLPVDKSNEKTTFPNKQKLAPRNNKWYLDRLSRKQETSGLLVFLFPSLFILSSYSRSVMCR